MKFGLEKWEKLCFQKIIPYFHFWKVMKRRGLMKSFKKNCVNPTFIAIHGKVKTETQNKFSSMRPVGHSLCFVIQNSVAPLHVGFVAQNKIGLILNYMTIQLTCYFEASFF